MIPLPPPPVQPAEPTTTLTRQSWLASNWKGLAAVVVVVVVVLSIVGLVFTQPWSKIKVIVTNTEDDQVNIAVYVDGVRKDSGMLDAYATRIIGVYSVVQGSHTVGLDGNYNYPYNLDDNIDLVHTFMVGPLYTKNAYIDIHHA